MIGNNEKIVNFDDHLKILNFLTYLQGIGVITEDSKMEYSSYIQEYLKEKKSNRDFYEDFLDAIKD